MANQPLDIDQDLARRLFVEGAILVFLNVPRNTEFGIDLKSWNTGDNFKGVKMIPPGLHYVYYSPVGKDGDTAPRTGFMYNFKTAELLVKKWDIDAEDLSVTDIEEEEKIRIRSNLLNIDRYMGPYPFEIWKKWKSLTNFISDSLYQRLVPECGSIRSAPEYVVVEETETPNQRRRSRPSTVEDREEDLLPQLKPQPEFALRLTPLPERGFPEGASPAEITKHSLDASYRLETMLQHFENPEDLLGELQFSFVCFLVGHSFDAFEHWKSLIQLLCNCEAVLVRQTKLYFGFLSVLEAQILEVPQDFLVDIVASSNFVYVSLRQLFLNLKESSGAEMRLKAKAAHFRERLTKRFMWDFSHLEEEDDDDAPVVVELQ